MSRSTVPGSNRPRTALPAMGRPPQRRESNPVLLRPGSSRADALGVPLFPAAALQNEPDQRQRQDHDGAEQSVRHRPLDQIADEAADRQDRVPSVVKNTARGDTEMGQQKSDQQAQHNDADRPSDHLAQAATPGLRRSHSSLTRGSSSRGSRRARSAAHRAGGASLKKAHAAAARTSGAASSSRRCAAAARSGSFESALPIAISTLRTNRSRPVRLIAVPAKSLRNAASSSSASAARRGAVSSSRGRKSGSRATWANLFQGQTARQSSHP